MRKKNTEQNYNLYNTSETDLRKIYLKSMQVSYWKIDKNHI